MPHRYRDGSDNEEASLSSSDSCHRQPGRVAGKRAPPPLPTMLDSPVCSVQDQSNDVASTQNMSQYSSQSCSNLPAVSDEMKELFELVDHYEPVTDFELETPLKVFYPKFFLASEEWRTLSYTSPDRMASLTMLEHRSWTRASRQSRAMRRRSSCNLEEKGAYQTVTLSAASTICQLTRPRSISGYSVLTASRHTQATSCVKIMNVTNTSRAWTEFCRAGPRRWLKNQLVVVSLFPPLI